MTNASLTAVTRPLLSPPIEAAGALAHDLPRCLYATTAPAPIPAPPLAEDTHARIVVVGGGYTGLSAALHLAERGLEVVLLEAHEPGWGAAGRNGGQVNAGLKHEPEAVLRDLGESAGGRLLARASGAPDFLFGLIDRLGIACEAERGGTLRAAYNDSQAQALTRSVEAWRCHGLPMQPLDALAMRAATGSARYSAGVLDPRGGSVNPLALARGLAAAAVRAGARLYGSTPALRLARSGGGWAIETADGTVRADTVLLATDGYTDNLWPGLRTSIVPVYSAIVATAPLPPALAAAVMPTRAVAYETGAITAYYRRDAASRLLIGGRGRQREALEFGDYRHLVRYAERLWPELARVEWTHWWNGQFALTPDFYPHFHCPAPNLYAALGYSGRGVALGTVIGQELASAGAGVPLAELAVPVTPIRPIPFHRFWRVGVAARIALGRLSDALGR